jgi:hypothetical protein
MNRRDFLSRFLQTAAGAAIVHTLDVDKLLWVAGERTIFLPPLVQANTLITPEFVAADFSKRLFFTLGEYEPIELSKGRTFDQLDPESQQRWIEFDRREIRTVMLQ